MTKQYVDRDIWKYGRCLRPWEVLVWEQDFSEVEVHCRFFDFRKSQFCSFFKNGYIFPEKKWFPPGFIWQYLLGVHLIWNICPFSWRKIPLKFTTYRCGKITILLFFQKWVYISGKKVIPPRVYMATFIRNTFNLKYIPIFIEKNSP